MHKSFFESAPSTPEMDLSSITRTFSQLSDIVSIIARYAVMENLYSQTPHMTLRSDYRAALIDLCVCILHWFSNAFMLVRPPEDDPSDLSTRRALSESLWDDIKQVDLACQKFTVVVEAKAYESEDEGNSTQASENEAAGIEDISDENMDDFDLM
jgi:hypothetical protein